MIELKTENQGAERKESRHESGAEIKSFEDEDPKPVPKSLTEEGSVRGRSLHSSTSTRSTRTSCVCSLRTDPTRIFQTIF